MPEPVRLSAAEAGETLAELVPASPVADPKARRLPTYRLPKRGVPRATPKHVEADAWGAGMVSIGPMAKILGIPKVTLAQYAIRGRIPCVVHNKIRWFDVDKVLRWVIELQVKVPPLIDPKSTEAEDFRWAWNALCLSPYRCCVAPSGRAWMIYLEARASQPARARLTAMFARLAIKQLGLDPLPRRIRPPRDRTAEKARRTDPGPMTADEIVEAEELAAEAPDEPLMPPTPAETALKALEDGHVSGPFAFDGEGY